MTKVTHVIVTTTSLCHVTATSLCHYYVARWQLDTWQFFWFF